MSMPQCRILLPFAPSVPPSMPCPSLSPVLARRTSIDHDKTTQQVIPEPTCAICTSPTGESKLSALVKAVRAVPARLCVWWRRGTMKHSLPRSPQFSP